MKIKVENYINPEWKEIISGDYKCAGCGYYIFQIDDTHAKCPRCDLRFRLKDDKVQFKGNMMEDYE